MSDEKTLPLSDRVFAAPFGRYQSGSDSGAGANEVLVGREEQRSYFIELLLRMGRRGAYLVTGRRGIGKTSFVNYCLAEYRAEVFERFLRSSVGRAFFWDHAGVLLLLLGIIFALLMVSELMELITLAAGWGKGKRPNLLFGLIIIPLALVCMYPLLHARELLGHAFGSMFVKASAASRRGIVGTVATASIAYIAFVVPPFGSPALSMSRLFLALGAMYLGVQSLSYNFDKSPNKGRGVALLALACFSCVCLGPLLVGPIGLTYLKSHQEFAGNLVWSMILFGGGSLLRSLHLAPLRGIDKSLDWPLNWYRAIGGILTLGPTAAFLHSSLGRPEDQEWLGQQNWPSVLAAWLAVLVAYGMFLAMRRGCVPVENISFRPRPSLVLAAKALLYIVLTLQLIHPIFDKWTPARGEEGAGSNESYLRSAKGLDQISSLSYGEYQVLRKRAEDRRAGRGDSETDAELEKEEKESRQGRDSAVFYGRVEEISWVFGLCLCLAAIYFIEYEWLLRPFVRRREDGVLNLVKLAPWHDQEPRVGGLPREEHRSLVQLTLPWILYDKWLPILAIGVNLGFEKLDHRRVVHAMLAGLRDQYHRAFQAWDSTLANLGRLFGFLLIMMLVTLAGDHWFGMPVLPNASRRSFADSNYEDICSLFKGRQVGAGAANWICKLPAGNPVFHILNYNLLGTESGEFYPNRDIHLLFDVFPFRKDAWPPQDLLPEVPPLLDPGIHLRSYHLALFGLFYVAGHWLLHRLPVFPYREIVNRIDDTMDSLASRTSVTSTMGRWKPAQWLQGFFLDERVRQTEQDPVDPRTVEFVFLQILRDIQNNSAYRLPGGKDQIVSLPTPEIIFVLDELDKIGTRVDPDEIGSSGGAQQAEILDSERRRSMELHKLLADMKNLLSAAPARFIFVGGRNLHDEWLADQTARQPLLTNIFTAEIYLPSLLTDHDDPRGKELSLQITNYLSDQLRRAGEAFDRAREKNWLPLPGLPLEKPGRDTFILRDKRADSSAESHEGGLSALAILDVQAGTGERAFPGKELKTDFVQFLAYRSMGNSKKLKELLETFVRSAGRVVQDDGRRWDADFRDCDHVLFFGDTERFRIQLLARVYRHLIVCFEQELVRRDDKLVSSVLFLTDFLFKFHRRAFSWSNLERVDDLVHIHRAPDLREILEAIVVQWSERFLHPIRNGMYDFRFRSDMAREIEYISRQSADEMAAFNFTLDESQALKSAYETSIARLRTENREDLQDLVAGLGELHEFDQEYEAARLHYRRAISLLDQELEGIVGGRDGLSEKSARIEIIGGEVGGLENARRHMTWGVARLRLMLQIGMTFEHGRNLERAQMEYQNARTLARSLLLAMLDAKGRAAATGPEILLLEAWPSSGDRLHALKHLNILFQPIFAEAWVAEKLTGGVDTSTTLAEQELWHLRNVLPFLREPIPGLSESGVEAQNSNFALIGTEIHNKAGDLYFFKGRQLVPINSLDELLPQEAKQEGSRGHEGYLLRAQYHYAVGLHELRRFIAHRKASSGKKLNIHSEQETIASRGWPDFVFRAVGGGFNDLADALLGQTSLMNVLDQLWTLEDSEAGAKLGEEVNELVERCTKWIESGQDVGQAKSFLGVKLGALDRWLGKWKSEWSSKDARLIDFPSSCDQTSLDTLLASLCFAMVGARYLEDGGYLEDAGRELLKVCDCVNQFLWSACTVHALARTRKGLPVECKSREGGWSLLCEVALYALEEAGRLFRKSRRAEDGKPKRYLVGEKLPVAAMTYACSLALVSGHLGQDKAKNRVRALLNEWRKDSDKEPQKSFRSILNESLVRHSYPMINRLHALRVFIDDEVLSQSLQMAAGEVPAADKAGEVQAPDKAGEVQAADKAGEVQAADKAGEVQAADKAGEVQAADKAGEVQAADKAGEVQAADKAGEVQAADKAGEVQAADRAGEVQAADKAGEVQAPDKAGEVQAPDKRFEKALTWTKELLDLNASLNAPLHFTPLQLGTTCALVYLLSPLDTSDSQLSPQNTSVLRLQEIRDAAERSLLSSQEMYTMRRAFYENISDLYYLYDDFNDRQLHFNHAIQMAGAELSSLLRHLIRTAKQETTQPCETPLERAPAAEPTCAG